MNPREMLDAICAEYANALHDTMIAIIIAELIRLIASIRAEAQRTEVWTPQQETDFQARIAPLVKPDHLKTDEELGQ